MSSSSGGGPTARRPRTYDDPCGVARALNLVGERWALLIVRELLFGPKRFTDLRRGLANISPNVLSQRLRDLEADGVVAQRTAGPPVSGAVYELTELGCRLQPVLTALATWGSRIPQQSVRELSPDALVLALQTTADPSRPRASGDFTLRFGADEITVHVDDREISATRVATRNPTAIIAADSATLRALIFGGRGPAGGRGPEGGRDNRVREHGSAGGRGPEGERDNRDGGRGPDGGEIAPGITVTGDADAARRFLGMFARPSAAPRETST